MTDKDPHLTIENDENSEKSPPTGGDSAGERQKTFSRRALLEAGWSVPLIAAVQFPTDAFAVSIPTHEDSAGHSDIPGSQHDDMALEPHVDTNPHVDTSPHSDGPMHSDSFEPHSDASTHDDLFSGPTHVDIPFHADDPPVPHSDGPDIFHGDANAPTAGGHADDAAAPHGDSNPHSDAFNVLVGHDDDAGHNDDVTPHTDAFHNDTNPHNDNTHNDGLVHSDFGTPHGDSGTPHGDTPEVPHDDVVTPTHNDGAPHNDHNDLITT